MLYQHIRSNFLSLFYQIIAYHSRIYLAFNASILLLGAFRNTHRGSQPKTSLSFSDWYFLQQKSNFFLTIQFQNPKSKPIIIQFLRVLQDAPPLLPLLLLLQTSQSLSHPNPPKMLSCPLLCPLTPPRYLNLDPIRRLPSSKARILIRGSEPKSDFGGRVCRIRVSDQINMPELGGMDAFKGSNGGGEEGEAILGKWSPAVAGDLVLGGFELTLNRMVSSS